MQIGNGLHTFRLPLPLTLDHLNVYLLEGKDGWSIIDTGLNYPAAQKIWERSLTSLGIDFTEIRNVVVTHFHIDHVGLAGWIQEKSGCRVFMSAQELEYMDKFQDIYVDNDYELRQFLFQHGFNKEQVLGLRNLFARVEKIIKPEPVVDILEDCDFIELGDRLWQVLITPGHASGHICLYDSQEEILLAGDQLLPSITSNISILPSCSINPLEEYLESLKRLKKLDIKLALPAHGDLFADVKNRIDQLFSHHSERLQIILDSVGEGKNAGQITDLVFGEEMDLLQRFLAVGETLAHLQLLIRYGLVCQQEGMPVIFGRSMG